MKKLAVCVLTHEHPEVVKDVLCKCIEDYSGCGIDMYYYDSTSTDATRQVIESFVAQGYHNLHYVKADCSYGEKVDMVYSGYGFVEKYDYIWPTKDRAFCPTETLLKVMEAMEEEHDFIVVGPSNRSDISSLTYVEAKDFYGDWGVVATSLSTLIYNYSSVLENYDSKAFLQRYPKARFEDWRVFVYVYSRLCELEEYSIKVLTGNGVMFYETPLGKSLWVNRTFQVWIDYWLQVNDSLPSYYDEYKEKVIKEATSLPWILGSVERLQELHELGVLTPESFEDIQKDWERVCDIPIQKVRDIAYGIYDCYHDLDVLEKDSNHVVGLLRKLQKFIREGKITKQQIPIEEVLECVLEECDNGRIQENARKNLLKGSVKDIAGLMSSPNTDEQMICNLLQMLINYILLLQ